MILNFMWFFMVKMYNKILFEVELEIYVVGLWYVCEFMMVFDEWVNIIVYCDGWFYFQIFFVFDVVSMFCVVVKLDENSMIFDCDFVIDVIDLNLGMLCRLNEVLLIVGVWYDFFMC